MTVIEVFVGCATVELDLSDGVRLDSGVANSDCLTPSHHITVNIVLVTTSSQSMRPIQRFPRRIARALILVSLTGCPFWQCPEDPVSPPPSRQLLEITTTPSALRVPRGGVGQTVLSSRESFELTTFVGMPGVSVALSRNLIEEGLSAIATVTASALTTAGKTPDLTIVTGRSLSSRGVGANGWVSLALEIVEPLALLTQRSVSVSAGQQLNQPVIIERTEGFTAPLTFSITGLPADFVVTFDPSQPDAAFVARYSITPPATATITTYAAQFVATGNGVSIATPVDVVVSAALPAPNISLLLSPPAITLTTSGSDTVGITLGRTGSPLVGAIALSVSGLPVNVTATFSQSTVTGTVSRMTLVSNNAVATTTPATVTVTGTANGVSRSATVQLTIAPPPSITLSANPASLMMPGNSSTPVSTTINVVRTGNVGAVTLNVPNPPPGITAIFTPSIVTSGTSSVLQLTGSGSLTAGNRTITVQATAGTVVQTVTVALSVTAPPGDFTAVFALQQLTAPQGQTTSVQLNLDRTGTLVGSPLTITVTDAPLQSIAVPALSPTTATVAFINLNPTATPIGVHPMTVRVTDGSVVRTATLNINVTAPPAPDFLLSSLPTTWALPRSAFTPFSIVVNPVGGFNAPITFSAVNPLPGNMIIEFVTNPATAFVTVRMYASPNVIPGPYTVRFTGTAGALVRTVDVMVVVQP